MRTRLIFCFLSLFVLNFCLCCPFAAEAAPTPKSKNAETKTRAVKKGTVKAAPAKKTTGKNSSGATGKSAPVPAGKSAPVPAGKSAPVPAGKSAPAPGDPAPATENAAARVCAILDKPYAAQGGEIQPSWQPLLQKLQSDPKLNADVSGWFRGMQDYSPQPMGEKIKELFKKDFMRRPPKDDGIPKPPPSRIYRNVVTPVNVQKCRDFLTANQKAFAAVEDNYPVPRNILVSLLFVETRLGVFVGKDNAFWSLACMAAADAPQRLKGAALDVPIGAQHDEWLARRLKEKSSWAYNELRSLLIFCRENRIDPRILPGSAYGAIGICQFMPSNITSYADDGDKDGRINLFSPPDAIFSAARYLSKNGWSKGMGVEGQRKALKRYNNLNIYANTILALAESIRSGVIQTGPPDQRKR